MIRNWMATLLAVFVVLSVFMVPFGHVAANTYDIGDYWEYDAEHSIQGLAIIGTIRMEYSGSETISVGGTEYDTIVFTWSGEGTFSGNPNGMDVLGNITLSGVQYFQESNQEWIKSIEDYFFNGTYSFLGSNGTWKLTLHNTTSYSLSVDEKLLNLKVGKLGHSVAMVTAKETSTINISGLGPTYWQNSTFQEEKYYNCTKKETITVEAGTFETYLIKTTQSDGSYRLDWRSEKVGNFVKVEVYNSSDEKQWSMELSQYHHEEPTTDSDTLLGLPASTTYIIASLLIVTVIILIFLLSIKRKR